MRRVFDALGVDYDQWKALTKTALRIDLRASRGWARPSSRTPGVEGRTPC